MRGESSAIQKANASLLAKEDESNEHASGTLGEIAVYLIFLVVLFALAARGWVYDLWSP